MKTFLVEKHKDRRIFCRHCGRRAAQWLYKFGIWSQAGLPLCTKCGIFLAQREVLPRRKSCRCWRS